MIEGEVGLECLTVAIRTQAACLRRSIWCSHLLTRFQLALFWATNLRSPATMSELRLASQPSCAFIEGWVIQSRRAIHHAVRRLPAVAHERGGGSREGGLASRLVAPAHCPRKLPSPIVAGGNALLRPVTESRAGRTDYRPVARLATVPAAPHSDRNTRSRFRRATTPD